MPAHAHLLRGSKFAIWKWRVPWWTGCLVILSAPVFYFLSAIPVLTLAVELSNLTGHYKIIFVMQQFYAPVFWLGKHSEFAGLVIAWEQYVMLSLFHRSA